MIEIANENEVNDYQQLQSDRYHNSSVRPLTIFDPENDECFRYGRRAFYISSVWIPLSIPHATYLSHYVADRSHDWFLLCLSMNYDPAGQTGSLQG